MDTTNKVILWLLPFFFLCLLVGVLSSLVGVVIYRRNFSSVIGGLTHFLLGPIAIAFFIQHITSIKINPYIFSAVIASIVMLLLPLNENGELRQAQHMNILWSFGMALGVIFLYISPNFTNLDFFLFGNIITISQNNMYLLIILTIASIFFFSLFHVKLSYLGIDDIFLKVKGINTLLYHKIQMVVITISIVLLLQILGILLLLTIVTLPTLIAAMFAKSYRTVLLFSIGISVLVLSISLICSFLFNIPISSFAALFFCCIFFISKIIALLCKS